MRRFFRFLPTLSDVSRRILSGSLAVWSGMLLSYVLLSCARAGLHTINLQVLACCAAYPLLLMMCLTLGVTGALLVDLYIKFDPER